MTLADHVSSVSSFLVLFCVFTFICLFIELCLLFIIPSIFSLLFYLSVFLNFLIVCIFCYLLLIISFSLSPLSAVFTHFLSLFFHLS